MKRFGFLIGFSFLAALPLHAASAAPEYYAYFFACDDGKMTPDVTHTFATFVALTRDAKGKAVVESQTISWLPKTGVVVPVTFGPERGRNFGLTETFAWCQKLGSPSSQWGPFSVTPELYTRAKAWKARLDSGEVWYRVLDTQNRIYKVLDPKSSTAPRAMMCSHAVADIVAENPADPRGWLLTGTTSGAGATAKVVWHLSDWFERVPGQPGTIYTANEATKAEMDAALGLDKVPARAEKHLEQQNNQYCGTLEACHATAGAAGLSLGSGLN